MGTKNQQSSGTSNGSSTTTLAPQVQAAYNALLSQLGGVSSGTNGATSSATAGLGSLAANSGSNPAYSSAASTLSSAATPAYASIGNYLSPYLSGALQTQIASQNQQNGQQQQQLLGNAAAQGALGGNRIGVAQGQLAGQQALANNQANSSLINSAYQQAENSAIAGQAGETGVGAAQAGLGSSTNASSLSDLLAQLSAGNSQFSNLGSLAGSASSLSNTGATTTTTGTTSETKPSGNWISSLLGAGLGIAGLFKDGGVVPRYDAGGEVGEMSAERAAAIQSAIRAATPQNDNSANDNSASPLSNLASRSQMQAGLGNIMSFLRPSSLPSGVGETGGYGSSYAGGGVVARGYDDGGYVAPYPDSFYSGLLDQITNAPDGSDPTAAAAPVAAAPTGVVPVRTADVVPFPSSRVVPPPEFDPSMLAPQGAPSAGAVPSVASSPSPRGVVPLAPLPPSQTAQPALQRSAPLTVATNNPGGISDGPWARSMPGYAGNKGDFAVFDSPASGQAAQLHLLNSYVNSGHNTIASVVNKWAPAAANAPGSTSNYIAYVAGKTGLDPNEPIPPEKLPDVAAAQAQWESGLKSGGFSPPSNAAAAVNSEAHAGVVPPSDALAFNSGASGVIPNPGTATGMPGGGIPGGNGVTPPGGFGIPDSNAGFSTNAGDSLKSLMAGKGLDLSPDARMALMNAGFGMMAGTSPFALVNVGAGAQAGMKTWMDKQELNRQNAIASSDIGNQQGTLDLAGKQLYLNAQKNAADIAQEMSTAGLTNVQAASARYVRTPTAAGLMVYDVTQPSVPPHIIPWNAVQPADLQGITPGGAVPAGVGAPGAGASGAPSGSAASAPSTDILPSASTQVPQQPIDPRQMNPNAGVQSQPVTMASDALSGAYREMQGAQTANGQLQELRNDLSTLSGAGGFLTPGAGFADRLGWANKANTVLSAIGMAPMFGPASVAAGEDAQKQTTRLGDALASSMGSREAAQIVMASVGATPGASQTPAGAAHIMAGLEAMNQRKIDYYTMAQKYAQQNNGTLSNYDAWFNQKFPPELYAISSYVPQQAMAVLRQNPQLAPQFDQKYGNGQQISKYVLGAQ